MKEKEQERKNCFQPSPIAGVNLGPRFEGKNISEDHIAIATDWR